MSRKRNVSNWATRHIVQWEFVKQGAGIGVITEAVGEAEPRVRRVLPKLAPIVFPMWLATHRELNTSKRLRTVFDFLRVELARSDPVRSGKSCRSGACE